MVQMQTLINQKTIEYRELKNHVGDFGTPIFRKNKSSNFPKKNNAVSQPLFPAFIEVETVFF